MRFHLNEVLDESADTSIAIKPVPPHEQWTAGNQAAGLTADV